MKSELNKNKIIFRDLSLFILNIINGNLCQKANWVCCLNCLLSVAIRIEQSTDALQGPSVVTKTDTSEKYCDVALEIPCAECMTTMQQDENVA